MASTLAAYKYLIIYGLETSYCLLVQYALGVSFSDFMWLFIDVGWTVVFTLTLPLAKHNSKVANFGNPDSPSTICLYAQIPTSLYVALAVALLASSTMVLSTPATFDGITVPAQQPSSDNVTTATDHINNNAKRNGTETKEFYLKIEINAINNNTPVPVPPHHVKLLTTILQTYGNQVTFFDKHDLPIEQPRLLAITSVASHKALFDTHSKAGNNNRKTRHTIIMKIRTSVSLYDIKNTESVRIQLKTLNIFIRQHYFPIDVHDIAGLGWFHTTHPSQMTYKTIKANIDLAIRTAVGDTVTIPQYHLSNCSPDFSDDNGLSMKTKAVQILMARSDQKLLDSLLKKAYANNPIYVPWRLKHSNPPQYRNCLRVQHKYLLNTWTLPVNGVNRTEMFYLHPQFIETGVISSVQQTRTTDTEGRWNLLVTRSEYKEACFKIQSILDKYEQYVQIPSDRATWSYPRTVGGKNGAKYSFDDENSNGDDSYGALSLASLASLLTVEDLAVPVTTSTATFDLSAMDVGQKSYATAVTQGQQTFASSLLEQKLTADLAIALARIDEMSAQLDRLMNPNSNTIITETPPTQSPSSITIDPPLPEKTPQEELIQRQSDYESRNEARVEQMRIQNDEMALALQQIMRAMHLPNPTNSGKHEATDASSLIQQPSAKKIDTKETPTKSHSMTDAEERQTP